MASGACAQSICYTIGIKIAKSGFNEYWWGTHFGVGKNQRFWFWLVRTGPKLGLIFETGTGIRT